MDYKVNEINPKTGLPKPGLKRLSPTALNWFEKDPDKFVLYYVLGAPRDKQTSAMAIGAGFDARVKGSLESDLTGLPNRWNALFLEQVEPHMRAFALDRSLQVFNGYKNSGAYSDLLSRLRRHIQVPQFEFDAAGVITVNDLEIPIYGKPDAYLVLPDCQIVLDWKVNGYMSQASPAKGYVEIRTEDGHNKGAHKDILPVTQYGFRICTGSHMREDWKTQLSMYQWMLDPEGKKPWIGQIEQLAYRKQQLRVATHRTIIEEQFMEALRGRVFKAWNAVVTEHYFTEMTLEESNNRVRYLRDMDDLDRWALLEG